MWDVGCGRRGRGGIAGVGVRVDGGVGLEIFDGVVDLAGVWGVEDGDGAAAFFGGVFGGIEGVEKGAEGVEAGLGEFLGVWRHGGPR